MADYDVRLVGDGPKNLRDFEAAFPGTSRKGLNAAGLAVKKQVTGALLVAGIPGRLSGVGAKGAKVGVRYIIKDTTVIVRATGPWQLFENATRPHLIVSKKLGGTRKRRTSLASGLFVNAPGRRITTTRGGVRGAVLTPQGPRAYAQHPGTAGKHPWKKGTATADTVSMRAYDTAVKAEMARQFRKG